MRIILLGPPGSGKSALARKISETYGFPVVNFKQVMAELSAVAAQPSELGVAAKAAMESGKVSGEVCNSILKRVLVRDDISPGFVLIDYPSDACQAGEIDQVMSCVHCPIDLVLVISIDRDELMERQVGRMECVDCGATYNAYSHLPLVDGVCDLCGGHLVRRPKDFEEKQFNRIREYDLQIAAVLGYYGAQGRLRQIDGNGSDEQTWQQVKKFIDEAPQPPVPELEPEPEPEPEAAAVAALQPAEAAEPKKQPTPRKQSQPEPEPLDKPVVAEKQPAQAAPKAAKKVAKKVVQSAVAEKPVKKVAQKTAKKKAVPTPSVDTTKKVAAKPVAEKAAKKVAKKVAKKKVVPAKSAATTKKVAAKPVAERAAKKVVKKVAKKTTNKVAAKSVSKKVAKKVAKKKSPPVARQTPKLTKKKVAATKKIAKKVTKKAPAASNKKKAPLRKVAKKKSR